MMSNTKQKYLKKYFNIYEKIAKCSVFYFYFYIHTTIISNLKYVCKGFLFEQMYFSGVDKYDCFILTYIFLLKTDFTFASSKILKIVDTTFIAPLLK